MKKNIIILIALCLTLTTGLATNAKAKWKDTAKKPMMVEGFAVHDINRPGPRIVKPGPEPKEPIAAPSDAIILFDGTKESLSSNWTDTKGKITKWKLGNNKEMISVNKAGYIQTKQKFGSCQLHIEFAAPNIIMATDEKTGKKYEKKRQKRGNSGLFLMGRYEIQILDSYKNQDPKTLDENGYPKKGTNHTYPDGQCGALYGRRPPMVNACRDRDQWQTFDIIFHRPVFENKGDKPIKDATFTVLHNGILIHDNYKLTGGTGWLGPHGVTDYSYHPNKGHIKLQDHGNPVRYRNIWIRELKD